MMLVDHLCNNFKCTMLVFSSNKFKCLLVQSILCSTLDKVLNEGGIIEGF